MAENKQICEFGTIWNAWEFSKENYTDHFDCIYLENRSFQSLKNFVAENNDPNSDVEQAFTLHRKKGKDFIHVKNFVGVVETPQGTTIEILPKIYQLEDVNDSEQKKEGKKLLLKMLRSLKNTPFKSIDQAHLAACHMPVLEIFISVFLKEMEVLLKRGIKHYYSQIDENNKFLKGRLIFHENLRKNLVHRERFFITYEEFKEDIPQNRVLKAALIYLKGKSRSAKNISRIINMLFLFEEVGQSNNLEKDLKSIDGQNRLFNYYSTTLKWARIFLQKKTFTNYKGNHLNTAILFPMETLFESYVAYRLKQTYPETDISIQDRKYFLLSDLTLNQRKFRLRPDIVINTGSCVIVADTKWKVINQDLASKNYLIAQADMYQLYAYGKKYQLKNDVVQLVLIYPKHEKFNFILSFEYESFLKIEVVPFDFKNESFSLNALMPMASNI